MESENKRKYLYVLLQVLLGATVFNWLIPVVETFPQDVRIQEQLDETFSDDNERYLSTPNYHG